MASYFCKAACSVPPVYWATSFKLFTLKMVIAVHVEAKHFGCMMVLNTKTGKLDNIYWTCKPLDYKLKCVTRGISSSEMMSTLGLSLKRHFEKCFCKYNYLCLTAEYLML